MVTTQRKRVSLTWLSVILTLTTPGKPTSKLLVGLCAEVSTQQITFENKEINSFQPTIIMVSPVQMNQTEAKGSETKIPSSPAVTFPRSPAWRFSSSGAPCSLPAGLKCGPRAQNNQFRPVSTAQSTCPDHTHIAQERYAVGTSRHAAVGGVTKRVHMEPMEPRLEARDTSSHSGRT